MMLIVTAETEYRYKHVVKFLSVDLGCFSL